MSRDMRGTMFDVDPQGPDDPIKLGCLQIEGVKVYMEIYHEQEGQKRRYNPIRLSYPNDNTHHLIPVKVKPTNEEY
ncbi:MAG: hypothetical protein MJZ81_07470 [Bacteroidales bacterium]|nr:hypothetical protein [Bacteroidales bacterium]